MHYVSSVLFFRRIRQIMRGCQAMRPTQGTYLFLTGYIDDTFSNLVPGANMTASNMTSFQMSNFKHWIRPNLSKKTGLFYIIPFKTRRKNDL